MKQICNGILVAFLGLRLRFQPDSQLSNSLNLRHNRRLPRRTQGSRSLRRRIRRSRRRRKLPPPTNPKRRNRRTRSKRPRPTGSDTQRCQGGSEKDVNSIGSRSVGKGVNLYSLQREIALGKQAAMEVEKTAKMINDPVVTEYVNRVGQNIVRNSDARCPSQSR